MRYDITSQPKSELFRKGSANLNGERYLLFNDDQNVVDQYGDLDEIVSNLDDLAFIMAQYNKESIRTIEFTKDNFLRNVDSFKHHLQQDIKKLRDPETAKRNEDERKYFIHIPGYDLIQQEPIGQGGFADVYHGKWLSRHHDVAIKKIRVENISDAVKQDFLKEIMALYQIRDEHTYCHCIRCLY